MNKQKVIYTGIFLDEESKVSAIKLVSSQRDLLDRIIAHHLTLQFKPPIEEVLDLPIGQNCSFEAIGTVYDNKAQAILCSIPDYIKCNNKHPHVTVSVANGVSPVYSNALLSRNEITRINPFTLTGRIGFFNGQKDCFDLNG